MNWEELTKKLVVQEGTFSLAGQVLTDKVTQWLLNYLPGGKLVITSANKEVSADQVVITGKTSLAGVDKGDATATFSLDAEGEVVIVLDVELDSESWTFDKSFPDIPGGESNPFADIKFSKCSLWLADMIVEDYKGYELYEGFNFCGVISASPLMTLLEEKLSVIPVMQGHITLEDREVPALGWGDYPFKGDSPTDPVPGFVFHVELQNYSSFSVGEYVDFKNVGLRMYCPPNNEFFKKNNTYTCKNAFAAQMFIPKLSKDPVNCVANYVPEWAAFEICVDTNINVGDIEKLVAFGDGKSLHDRLPKALQAAQLDDLTLSRFCIDFNVASGMPQVDDLMLTVSMPNAQWSVLDKLTIEQLSSTFTYIPNAEEDDETPLSVSVSGVIKVGDVVVAVRAETEDEFTLYLDTKNDINIPLGDYLKSFWPGAEEPPTVLTINNVSVEISPTNYVEVLLRMASDGKAWIIPVGSKRLTMSDFILYYNYQFDKNQTANGKHEGYFSGTVDFDEKLQLTATVEYPFDKGISILMRLPEFSLRDLITKFGSDATFLPEKFNISLKDSMVMFEKAGDTYRLKLATLVNDCAFMTFELMDDGGSKGFIFGVNIDGDKLSNLFDMWDLSFINRVFKLDQLALVASTTDIKNYSFPVGKEFDVPAFEELSVNNPGAGKLEEGLTFMAAWKIDTTHQEQAVLAKLLDINAAMAVYMHLGTGNKYKLYAELDSKICGYDIRGKVGARYESPEFAFFIEGEIVVPIQKHDQKFKFDLAFSNLGAFGSGSMVSTQQPVDFGCFKLGNLAVQLGISWEMVPSFGLTGIIGIKSFQSSIAVLFDSGNPARSMIAGSVSQLTLKDVFDVFLPEDCESKRLAAESINDVRDVLDTFGIYGTGSFKLPISKAEEFNNADLKAISNTLGQHKIQVPNNYSEVFYSIGERDKSWFITVFRKGRPRYYEIREKEDPKTLEKYLEVSKEAQFYVVPESTRIGAFDYEQGFYINGMLKMNKFSIEAEVEISKEKFMVHAKMSKVYLGNGILCIAGVNEAHTGPSEEGPELIIQTDQEPYAYLDAYISFLSVESKWKAIVNQYGFSADFGIKGKLGSAEVAATLIAKERFSAHMELALNPFFFETLAKAGKVFGDFELKFGASASVSFEIGKTSLSIKALAVFRINEFLYRTPKFKFEVTPKDIEELASLILDKIKERLLELLEDPVEFAKMVLEGFLVIVGKLEDAIMRLYKKTVEEVEKIVTKAKEAIERLCTMEKATEEM